MSNFQESSELISQNPDQTQPMQFQQLQQMVFSVVQQVKHHQTLFEELQALKDQVSTLQTEKQALANENQLLRTQLSTLQINFPGSDLLSIAQHDSSSSAKVTTPTFASVTAAHTPKTSRKNCVASGSVSLKKRIAAARVFKTAEAQGPQGFTYVYLGRSRKLDRLEVRSRLRRAGVDTGRVIDVCFPASGVIGVLLHTQYVEKFTELMTVAEAEFIKNFDPLHPDHLADPKFVSLSNDARADEMASIVHSRCLNTLAFVRPLLVSSVGRSFVDLGWIDDEALNHALEDAQRRLALQDPKKASFVFRRSGGDNGVLNESDTEMSL
jgi:hypothetical protein